MRDCETLAVLGCFCPLRAFVPHFGDKNTSALSFSAEVLSATLACSFRNYTTASRS